MYAIIDLNTNNYLTLFSTPHFTNNPGIIQQFYTEKDAMLCAETVVWGNDNYELFESVDAEIVKL